MSWLYRHCLRPWLFAHDSEWVHHHTLAALARVSRHPPLLEALDQFFGAPALPVNLWGLDFPNPVGLAAGMDKSAEAVPVWASLGFGFVELGGVTWHPQPGNPLPRIFRAVSEEALVNRMGFNNPGASAIAQSLHAWRTAHLWPAHPVGINLGKSKITPLADAAGDYLASFRCLRDLADFFVVNVSSPNTPGLRQLQDKSALQDILAALQSENVPTPLPQRPCDLPPGPKPKPILVKVAPDLTRDALQDILDVALQQKVHGLIATNTTLARPTTCDPAAQCALNETGGLSGRPLRTRSTEVIQFLYRQTQGRLPIIGVGGIFSAADAWEKITAGASLIQLYTGLVFEGPGLPGRIVRGLQDRLRQEGFRSLSQAVGTAGPQTP